MRVDTIVPGKPGQMMPIGLDDIKIAVALTIRAEDDFGAIRGPVGIGIEARNRWEIAWQR